MLRPRGCDRPKPSGSWERGPESGVLHNSGLDLQIAAHPPLTPPAFKTCNFPLMGKYSRSLRSGVYDGKKNVARNKAGGALGSPVLPGTGPDLRSVDVLLIL